MGSTSIGYYEDLDDNVLNVVFLFENLTPNLILFFVSYFGSLLLMPVGGVITMCSLPTTVKRKGLRPGYRKYSDELIVQSAWSCTNMTLERKHVS